MATASSSARSRSASSPPTARCWAPSGAAPAPSTGWAPTARACRRARSRPSRSTGACAPRAAGEHRRRSGLGRQQLTLDGELAFDVQLELPPGADPAEGHMRPPQHGVPVVLEAGQEVALVLRHEPPGGGADTSFDIAGTAFQLNVEPPYASDEEELERAVAPPRDADVAVVVVGTTEEVESEGFDRESLALPGRQDELVRRVVAANPRTVVVVNAGAPVLLPWADEVPGGPADLVPGPGVRPRARRRAAGRRRARRAPADHLARHDRRAAVHASPSTGRSPTTRASSSATAPTSATGAAAVPFGHGLGYTSWEYLELACDAEGVQVPCATWAPGAAARSRRSTRRAPTARSSAPPQLAGGLRGRPRSSRARRPPCASRCRPELRALGRRRGRLAVEPGTYRITAGPSTL